ncbi:MAG: hypothetical protein Q7S92_06695 [Candidatus Diapherotrites archaeon]|nr:hypothetical protein [Candidatus Diapherotrites archaeon]
MIPVRHLTLVRLPKRRKIIEKLKKPVLPKPGTRQAIHQLTQFENAATDIYNAYEEFRHQARKLNTRTMTVTKKERHNLTTLQRTCIQQLRYVFEHHWDMQERRHAAQFLRRIARFASEPKSMEQRLALRMLEKMRVPLEPKSFETEPKKTQTAKR